MPCKLPLSVVCRGDAVTPLVTLCRLAAGLDVLIPELGVGANRNFPVRVQLG